MADAEWETIKPEVSAEAEFLEIVHDFGNPLEIVREAISNAVDAGASWIKIAFDVDEIDGAKRLVVTFFDNGSGMSKEVLSRDFWGLGYSPSRARKDAIGEKGHGTKIYLRSESVLVRTQTQEGSYLSEYERPLSSLTKKQLHQPKLRAIPSPFDHSGTEIRITGYNDNVRSEFVQDIIKDYLVWFTKVGSVEQVFGITACADFIVYLKAIDRDDYEEITFGHPFPPENSDINKLFQEKGADAADWYVKRYVWKGMRLDAHPEVTFDAVISVEGDSVKRSYNKMVGERRRPDTGRYRMIDRYGIWLCKDHIPIARVNDWITGFGSGSNAFVLLHGFVNCQSLKLTANRGDIANTDPMVLEELKASVKKLIDRVDKELGDKGIYTLREWQEENRTLQDEKTEFDRRTKNLRNRRIARLDGRLLVEPSNEAELSGLLVTIYALRPDIFDFQPLDYNTNRGIDIIARNRSDNPVLEGEHWYVELKHTLRAKRFNHAFKYLRWIVCWEFDKGVGPGTRFEGIEENDSRELKAEKLEDGCSVYFLDSAKKATKVQVIRLREFIKQRLELEFDLPIG